MSRYHIFVSLALLLAGCSGSAKKDMPVVRLAPAEKSDLIVRYVASGHVRSKTIKIASPDTGVIVAFPVELNTTVKKGDLLFQIDDTEARAALRQMQADAAGAQAQLSESVANESLQARQTALQAQQATSQERQADLSLSQAESGARSLERQKLQESLRQSRRSLEASWDNLQRQRSLYGQDIVSPVDMVNTERAYKNDRSSYQQVLSDYRLQEEGTRREELDKLRLTQRNAQISSQLAVEQQKQADLTVFRSQANAAKLQAIRAQIDRQKHLVDRKSVKAPADGTISQRDFEIGETVNANSPVLTLVTHGPYWVDAEVDEQDASHVKVGQLVRVALTAFPGKSFEAKISEVGASLETPPGAPADHKVLKIRVRFLKPFEGLRSGLEADVNGNVELATQTLSVPRASLHRDQGQDFLYTVENGKLHKVLVKLGSVSSERAEIREGVQPGQSVVVEGGEGLPDGTPVTIAK